MGRITSLFVHKVIRQADDNLDRRGLLQSVGVDPDAPVDPKVMAADTDYYDFLERLASADPSGTDLPLRAGATMRCEDYGAFGLAWKSALTLRDSCERTERYARVHRSVATYEVRETDEGVYMHLHRDGDREKLGLNLEEGDEDPMQQVLGCSVKQSDSISRMALLDRWTQSRFEA